MTEDRKYAFSWDLLGDLELGRPNLGNTTRLEVYRLDRTPFVDPLPLMVCGPALVRELGVCGRE